VLPGGAVGWRVGFASDGLSEAVVPDHFEHEGVAKRYLNWHFLGVL